MQENHWKCIQSGYKAHTKNIYLWVGEGVYTMENKDTNAG